MDAVRGAEPHCARTQHSLWLSILAAVVLAGNTLFAAATTAFVTLGRWLGMRVEDE